MKILSIIIMLSLLNSCSFLSKKKEEPFPQEEIRMVRDSDMRIVRHSERVAEYHIKPYVSRSNSNIRMPGGAMYVRQSPSRWNTEQNYFGSIVVEPQSYSSGNSSREYTRLKREQDRRIEEMKKRDSLQLVELRKQEDRLNKQASYLLRLKAETDKKLSLLESQLKLKQAEDYDNNQ